MPNDDGSMTSYAYWVDIRDGFAFRQLDGFPPVGPNGLPTPPDSTGNEIVVPASHMMALAEVILERGVYDQAIDDPSLGSGVSIRNDRVRIFAERTFSTQGFTELLLVLGFLMTSGTLLILVVRRLWREQAARRRESEARSRMIRVREAERALLAREIHDGPIQNLYALRLQAHAALLTEEAAQDYALEAGLQKVSQELRFIMEGLRPPALDRFGFTAAVESHAARISQGDDSVDIRVSMEAETLLSGDNEDLQLGVFRVVQEALSNAVQHGEGHVQVLVALDSSTLVAEISDAGNGFPHNAIPLPDELVESGHYGLVGMRERAEVLGGELSFRPNASGGTSVTLQVPAPALVLAS
ncbi:MAG: ATP-binding protein [Bacteroidota bacterium]